MAIYWRSRGLLDAELLQQTAPLVSTVLAGLVGGLACFTRVRSDLFRRLILMGLVAIGLWNLAAVCYA